MDGERELNIKASGTVRVKGIVQAFTAHVHVVTSLAPMSRTLSKHNFAICVFSTHGWFCFSADVLCSHPSWLSNSDIRVLHNNIFKHQW